MLTRLCESSCLFLAYLVCYFDIFKIIMWFFGVLAFSPNEPMLNLKTYGLNWPSVWVKMTSSWICIIIFFISLCFPQCLPGGKQDGGRPWSRKAQLVWMNTMLTTWLLSWNLRLKIAVSDMKNFEIISSLADIIPLLVLKFTRAVGVSTVAFWMLYFPAIFYFLSLVVWSIFDLYFYAT